MKSSLRSFLFLLILIGATANVIFSQKAHLKEKEPPPFKDVQKEILKHIDNRINLSKKEWECVSKAKNHRDLIDCQKEHRRAMRVLGPLGPRPKPGGPCGGPGEPPCKAMRISP